MAVELDRALAQELASHRRWEWRSGAFAVDAQDARWRRDHGRWVLVSGRCTGDPVWPLLPDLTDDGMSGVLLGMLPPGRWTWEVWGARHAVWNTDEHDGTPAVGLCRGEAAGRALLGFWRRS